MIDCGVFLDRHSDYRDRRLSPELRQEMQQHMAACERCRRHDEALRRGIDILRRSEIEAARPLDMDAVRRRVRKPKNPDDDGPGFPGPASAAAFVAATVATLGGGA